MLAAAIREVREETGVEGIPLRAGVFDIDVHPIPASRGRPPHNHYDVRFLLEAVGEELVVSDEVLGARWVPVGGVGAIVTDRSVLRAATKLPSVPTSTESGSVQSSVEDAAGSAGSGSPSAL